jgi:hypothetical protein
MAIQLRLSRCRKPHTVVRGRAAFSTMVVLGTIDSSGHRRGDFRIGEPGAEREGIDVAQHP